VTSDDNCSDNQLEEPEKSAEDQWDNTEDVIASGMASASAGFASGVDPKHLSTIWRNVNGVTLIEVYETSHSLRAKWRSKREKCLMN
jgi:hypothetical protein